MPSVPMCSVARDMPNTKPHPDVYLAAAALGVDPALRGDRRHRDRRHRRRRGRCDRVWFQRGRPAPQHAGGLRAAGAKVIFQRMEQLPAVLAAYAADAAA